MMHQRNWRFELSGMAYRLHAHFEVFIPVGRAINPITNQNWEGRGVVPGISVAVDQALEAAYEIGLQSILETMADPISGPFIWLLEESQTALKDLENKSLLVGR
jgi:hypothetical protein